MSYLRIAPSNPVEEYIESFIDKEAIDAWNGEPRAWPWTLPAKPRPVGHSNRAIEPEPLSFTIRTDTIGENPCRP